MAENEVAKQAEGIAAIKDRLDQELKENMSALPSNFNKQRFLLNCMAVLKGDLNKFKGCSGVSIVGAFAKGAYLGLDFFNGDCYAIPYGKDVNFQTDYKGERKLAKMYSKKPIEDIYAKVVREGDEFVEQIIDGDQSISFKPIPFSNNEMIGAFAVVKFKDGSMLYETMSREDIETIRNKFSKAGNSKAWKDTPGEMYKKTVLRRLLKSVDLVFENNKQDMAFADGGDLDKEKANDVVVEEAYDAFANARVVETEDGPQVVDAEEIPPNHEIEPERTMEDEFADFENSYKEG